MSSLFASVSPTIFPGYESSLLCLQRHNMAGRLFNDTPAEASSVLASEYQYGSSYDHDRRRRCRLSVHLWPSALNSNMVSDFQSSLIQRLFLSPRFRARWRISPALRTKSSRPSKMRPTLYIQTIYGRGKMRQMHRLLRARISNAVSDRRLKSATCLARRSGLWKYARLWHAGYDRH